MFTKYAKWWTALTGAAVLIVGTIAGVDSSAYTTVVALVTALGVFFVPNVG